jgi:hypothetical protein
MVCSTERSKYPFDIQHRTVFVKVQQQITARLESDQESDALREIAEADG